MKLSSSEHESLVKKIKPETQESSKHKGMFESISELFPGMVALGETEGEAEANLEKVIIEEIEDKKFKYLWMVN